MQCPRCHQSLHTIAMDTVTVDECTQCGGIWFDQGELDEVIESAHPDLAWLDLDFWKNQDDFRVAAGDLPCPRCRRYYLTRMEDPDTATAAALCNHCRGIWLDADQLRRIIAAVTRMADRMDSADYVKTSLQQLAQVIEASPNRSATNWRDLQALLRMLKYRLFSEHPKLVSILVGAQKSLPL